MEGGLAKLNTVFVNIYLSCIDETNSSSFKIIACVFLCKNNSRNLRAIRSLLSFCFEVLIIDICFHRTIDVPGVMVNICLPFSRNVKMAKLTVHEFMFF